jgi:Spy/CpxP family protein refolding chaperone
MTNPTGIHPSDELGGSQNSISRWRLLAVLLLVVALFTTVASAIGPRGWHHGGPFGRGETPPVEEIQEHLAVKIKWALQRLDATPEQNEKIQGIAFASLERLMALRENGSSIHEQMAELMQAERIDREALETIRQEKVQMMDGVSREIAETMADILDVLTPEQRQQVTERFEQFHH